MSKMRPLREKLRAIVAVAGACALIFGLLLAGAPRAAHGFAAASAVVAADCDHAASAEALPAHLALFHHGGDSDKRSACPDCPACCLGAGALSPTRVAVLAQPTRSERSGVYYADFSAQTPRAAPSSAVNGARAPPARA